MHNPAQPMPPPQDGRKRPAARSRRCRAFTLVELLAVMTLIAMLAAVLMAAAHVVMKNIRKKQAEATAAALQTAVTAYRHEYNKWPIDPSLVSSIGTNSVLSIPRAQNYLVFDMLAPTHAANPNHVRFIDESAVLVDVNGQRQWMYIGGYGHPAVYVNPDGGITSYSVTIDVEQDTVSVDL
jgi:prepilin-type N-terminal cleavage/methylation domain-containing protein